MTKFLKNQIYLKIKLILKRIVLLLIRGYQKFISPFLGKNCIFIPSCSAYTYEAIEKYGIIRGGFLGVKRILRCHPFNQGGYDPVPQLKNHKERKDK